ncbi:MAG: type II toxin-antitoxin system RelE/ParE family toxin [Alphaproteobacteria bacterium]|nr:type II toxin-antitoxin system RelE/ParE family toxin [Alphaproteobacteria bacterium]
MIKSFNCRETEKIFNGKRSKKIPTDIQRRAFQKLTMLDASENVDDLRVPPSNMLESLSGDRKGRNIFYTTGKGVHYTTIQCIRKRYSNIGNKF